MTPLTHLTTLHVLTLGFLLGLVFPALYHRWRTPPSGNEAGVGAL